LLKKGLAAAVKLPLASEVTPRMNEFSFTKEASGEALPDFLLVGPSSTNASQTAKIVATPATAAAMM